MPGQRLLFEYPSQTRRKSKKEHTSTITARLSLASGVVRVAPSPRSRASEASYGPGTVAVKTRDSKSSQACAVKRMANRDYSMCLRTLLPFRELVVSSQRKPKQTGEGASNLPPVQASGCRGRRNSQQIFGQTRDSTCQKPWPLQLINLRQAGVARPPAHDRARLTAWSWVVVRAPKEGNLWQIYGAFFVLVI